MLYPKQPKSQTSNATGKNSQPKKKLYGILGSAALAAAVTFGGAGFVNSASAQSLPSAVSAAYAQIDSSALAQPFAAQPGKPGQGQRGAPGDRKGQPGISGTLSAISGNTLTLKQGDVITSQATVNSATTYSRAGQAIQLSDLKVGQKLNLRTTAASDGTLSVTAVDVILNHAGGTISAVDSSSLTLTRPDNTTSKVSLSASTKIINLGQTVSAADLKAGVRVEVAGETGADGTIVAEVVNIQNEHINGKITAISGSDITIQVEGRGRGGQPGQPGMGERGPKPANPGTQPDAAATPPSGTVTPTVTIKTVSVSGSTVYLEGGQTIKLSDLAVGDRINAAGTLSSDGNSLSALEVRVELPHYQGQVVSVNGSTIVLQDQQPGRPGADAATGTATTRTIEVTGSTKYLNGQATASLSDVKAGSRLSVEGQVDANGKMTASVVQLGQPQGKGPQPGR